MLPVVDLDIFRSQPLASPEVTAECTKVSISVAMLKGVKQLILIVSVV